MGRAGGEEVGRQENNVDVLCALGKEGFAIGLAAKGVDHCGLHLRARIVILRACRRFLTARQAAWEECWRKANSEGPDKASM